MKKNYFYIALFVVVVSCKNTNESQPKNFVPNSKTETEATYHEDTTYKYENRTGGSGSYQYNYDVLGADENGNDVTGSIAIEGKYGRGTIKDTDGNEIEVEVEWIDYGKLKATDEDGKQYELEVD